MKKVLFLLQELRAPFFTASIIPVCLGAAVAWAKTGIFNFWFFLLTLLGGVLLHAGTNVGNDFYDYMTGNDNLNQFLTPFSGGSRMIQKGLLKPHEVLLESLACFVLGSLIGLFLVWQRGLPILYLGLIGVFSGFFYSAPPFKLAGSSLGEFIVGLNFGVLMTLGAYFVQVQNFSWEAFVASVPVALLIAAVLYINEFPDYDADKAAGKKHLVVRLGKQKARWGYVALISLVYLWILLFAGLNLLPLTTFLVFFTFPLAWIAIQTVLIKYAEPLGLVKAQGITILLHTACGLLLILAYFLVKI